MAGASTPQIKDAADTHRHTDVSDSRGYTSKATPKIAARQRFRNEPSPEVSGCDDYHLTVSEGVRGRVQRAIGSHLDGGRFGHLDEHGRIAVDDLGDLTAEELGHVDRAVVGDREVN